MDVKFWQDKNVLVTGAAGLAGVHVLKQLIPTGANICATYHSKPPVVITPEYRIRYVDADLTRREECERVVKDMDYVIMCAASTSGAAVIAADPMIHVHPTVVMASWMLDAAYKAGVKKFLWISSTIVYPNVEYPVKEEDMSYGDLYPRYFFAGWARIYIEKLCEMYWKLPKPSMKVVVLRPSNFYGPHSNFKPGEAHVIPAFIRQVVERRSPLIIWGDGSEVRDFVYTEDFADAALLAVEKLDSPDPVNIGSGVGTRLNDLLSIILEEGGYTGVGIEYDRSKPTMIPVRLIDVSKAARVLHFTALTPLREGIRRTIEWYRSTCTQ